MSGEGSSGGEDWGAQDGFGPPIDDVTLHNVTAMADTARAILCELDDGDTMWFPRSQIVCGDIEEKGDQGSMTITGWIAEQKGLR